jgi:hypothetical protein
VNIGYLKSWDVKPMSSKRGYKLVLTPGSAIKEILQATRRKHIACTSEQNPLSLSESQELAKSSLVKLGVTQPKAEELARKYEPAELLDRVEYVMFQIRSDHRSSIKNPAGYLISFIEGEQQIPPTFQTNRHRQTAQTAREEETARSLAEMQLREEYDKWQTAEVDAVISREFQGELFTKKLNETAIQLRKDEDLDMKLNRMAPEFRHSVLMQALRKEILKELDLPSFEEWRETNSQCGLF